MSHFKAEIHQIRFPASVRLSIRFKRHQRDGRTDVSCWSYVLQEQFADWHCEKYSYSGFDRFQRDLQISSKIVA